MLVLMAAPTGPASPQGSSDVFVGVTLEHTKAEGKGAWDVRGWVLNRVAFQEKMTEAR